MNPYAAQRTVDDLHNAMLCKPARARFNLILHHDTDGDGRCRVCGVDVPRMRAAIICPHDTNTIDRAPNNVCPCGIMWDVPDPGYPYRAARIVDPAAATSAERDLFDSVTIPES